MDKISVFVGDKYFEANDRIRLDFREIDSDDDGIWLDDSKINYGEPYYYDGVFSGIIYGEMVVRCSYNCKLIEQEDHYLLFERI